MVRSSIYKVNLKTLDLWIAINGTPKTMYYSLSELRKCEWFYIDQDYFNIGPGRTSYPINCRMKNYRWGNGSRITYDVLEACCERIAVVNGCRRDTVLRNFKQRRKGNAVSKVRIR